MIGKLFRSKPTPIGVDVGRCAMKLAQVAQEGGELKLVASATIEVPAAGRSSSAGPLELFAREFDRALNANGFRGRQIVLGLPASYMHVDRLRLPTTLNDEELRQAVAWESIDKLPFHPSKALLRHMVAGRVYDHDEAKSEVIVMAARQELADRLITTATKAKLEILSMRPEPLALAGVFNRAAGCSGKQNGAPRTLAMIDVGHGATRLYIASGACVQFARVIGIGWEHLKPQEGLDRSGTGPLQRLLQDLSLSVHYHAETFPATPIKNIVVFGGAANQPWLCAEITAMLGIEAHVGDPLHPGGLRSSRTPNTDGTQSRPELAVAVGLSLAMSEAA